MRFVLPVVVLAAATVVPLVVPGQPASAAPSSATVVSIAGGGVNEGQPATEAALRAYAADYGPDGSLYVADSTNNRVTRVTSTGTYTVVAGTGDLTDGHGGFAGDGSAATSAQLFGPSHVHTTPSGDVIITDSGNHRVRLINHATGVISTIAGNGTVGTAVASSDATTQPLDPADAVYDAATGNIDIADQSGGRVWARHSDGSLSLLAGSGPTFPGDGPATSARLYSPIALAFMPNGDLLIADYSAQSGTVRELHSGNLTTIAGLANGPSADGNPALGATLPQLGSIAAASDGTVYVGTALGINSFPVGGAISTLPAPNYARVATVDSSGHLIVASGPISRRETDGSYTRIVGNAGSVGYENVPSDGVAAAKAALSAFSAPLVVGTDTYLPGRITVDRLGADGKVHRFAGTGTFGYAIPTGAQALATPLSSVSGLAVAPSGGLFVNDSGRVALIAADGTMTSYTGSNADPSQLVEGEDASKLSYVGAMVSASNGDLYFSQGPLLGVISHSDHTVHIIVRDVQQPIDNGVVPSNPETIRSLALTSSGQLLELGDRQGDNANTVSLLRSVDPSTAALTVDYFGPLLSSMTEGADGTVYAAEPVAGHGNVVVRLGTDGSTERLLGGGHTSSASQTGDATYLSDIGGLGIAADGSVLIAAPAAHRYLELQPGFTGTELPSVTNLAITSTLDASGSYYTQTATWDLPASMPAGTHIEFGHSAGGYDGPSAREEQPSNATSVSATIGDPGSRISYSVYVVSGLGEQSAPTTAHAVTPGDTTPPRVVFTREGRSVDSTLSLRIGAQDDGGVSYSELRLLAGDVTPTSAVAPVYTGSGSDNSPTITGLVVGQEYSALITSYDWTGNAGTYAFHFVAGSEPEAAFDGGVAEGAWVGQNAYLSTAAPGAFAGSSVCVLDGVTIDCGGSVINFGTLSEGSHSLAFHFTNSFGDGPTITRTFKVDLTAPTVTLNAIAPFTAGQVGTWTMKGTDSGSGVTSYRYRYQRASASGAFTAFSGVRSLTAPKLALTLSAGSTYCVQVQSVDAVGNTSAWSPSRCTTRPLDDRGLSATSKWVRSTGRGFFGRTITTTSTLNQTLKKSATFRQIAVLATTCSHCGTIAVYAGSSLIRSINLHSATTKHQVLFVLPVLTSRTAVLTIKVTSKAKTVQVDGVGFARA